MIRTSTWKQQVPGLFLYVITLTHLSLGIISYIWSKQFNIISSDVILSTAFISTPFLLGCFLSLYHIRGHSISSRSLLFFFDDKPCRRIFNSILVFSYAIFIFEILIAKGIPLLTILNITPNGPSYITFGIPTIHGFVNSLFYSILALNVIFVRMRIYSFLCLIPFIFGFARGWLMIISLLFSIRFTVMNLSYFHFKAFAVTVVKLLMLFILISLGFGFLGNIRVGVSPVNSFWLETFNISTPLNLPLFDWSFIYLIGTYLNSINVFNSEVYTHSFVSYIFSKLPTVFIQADTLKYDLFNYPQLRIHEQITTFNGYADIYFGLGPLGLLLALFIMSLSLLVLDPSSNRKSSCIFLGVHNIVLCALMFFNNFYFELPFILPFLIGIFIIPKLNIHVKRL